MPLKRTGLHAQHVALGAKMIEFSGWEMPLQYQGIIEEHLTVRRQVGLFDVSHMGRIDILGKEAEKLIDFLSTNRITGRKEGAAIYTVWCLETGGCLDDLIVFKHHDHHFSVIINASNRDKDLEHLRNYAQHYDVSIRAHYSDGILAVQGPQASIILQSLFPTHALLKPMHVCSAGYRGAPLLISGTGYTGAGGFELYGPMDAIVELWSDILHIAAPLGIKPVGLGARNTLRLEMGFPLYGHELTESLLVTETLSHWTVKMEGRTFLGKPALLAHPQRRFPYAVRLEKGIAREEYPVFFQGQRVGRVTSGTMSPSLKCGIALILVETNLHHGDNVEIEIRGQRHTAAVVNLPFLRGE